MAMDLHGWWRAAGDAARQLAEAPRPQAIPTSRPRVLRPPLEPLICLRLTDEVSRTLFAEYADHRAGERGSEETGWALLGLRERDEALVLATLPAGMERNASQAHVRFNSSAQALASRIVRQNNRRLRLLGIVHTHPGRLRHPSDGDLRGDRQWVGQLRGGEGVFGIGTADADDDPQPGVAWQPQPHRQCQSGLDWSWYVLAEGDRNYRPLPVEVTLGPDLARPLRPVWNLIEEHSERLDRLAQQLARVRFAVADDRPALIVEVPLTTPDTAIRIILEGKEVRYLLLRNGNAQVADLPEPRVDQGVYLLLADLAADV